jgi:hypothetical protein
MEAARLIEVLCLRYGIGRDFGDRLVPLAEIALSAPPEKRERLLEVLERSFAEEERRRTAALRPRDLPPPDFAVVRAVATALHAWNPPLWLRLWEESRRRAQSS